MTHRKLAMIACAVTALMTGNALAGDESTTGVTGACCLVTDTCQELTEQDCAKAAGFWVGKGTLCADAGCDAGRCCIPPTEADPDGGCTQPPGFGFCSGKGGVFEPNASCDTDCPGACCMPGGACMEVDQPECQTMGGVFAGQGELCTASVCDLGSCCFTDGTCDETIEGDCMARGGSYTPGGTCTPNDCPILEGACCLAPEDCIAGVTQEECENLSGTYLGNDTACAPDSCPFPESACCFPSGACMVMAEDECENAGGTINAAADCSVNPCPQPEPTGSCCFEDGSCTIETTGDCDAAGGTYQGDDIACIDANCPVAAPGACCIGDSDCQILLAEDCSTAGGNFQGDNTDCGYCVPAIRRLDPSVKGSCLLIPNVSLWYTIDGQVIRDTVLTISNDSPDNVRFLMYWVNGDPPILPPFAGGEGYSEPGWNAIDVEITLTGNQSAVISLGTGNGTFNVPPFSVLDPEGPGRPCVDAPEINELRGFIYGWAIDESTGMEITHNHLSAHATVCSWSGLDAWEYGAFAAQRLTDEPGDGELNLDGEEYAMPYSMLTSTFFAVGSYDDSETDVELTLQPVTADLRADSPSLPVKTKAEFNVWNEFEVKLSGAYRCVTCWDQEWLSEYGSPNHFVRNNLGTTLGRFRVDGVASALCDEAGHLSEPAAIIGLRAHRRYFFGFGGGGGGGKLSNELPDYSGTALTGMGHEEAVINYLPTEPPPVAPDSVDDPFSGIATFLEDLRSSRK